MRKRRVFALLLALSLAVSGNGMTVLANEQGADMPVSVSQEDALETGDKSVETEPSAEEDGSNEDDKAENDKTLENSGNPEEDNSSAPKEEKPGEGGDQPAAEENGEEKQEETTEEPVTETPEEKPVEEVLPEEPVKEVFEARPYVSRMVTFTDDIGMSVTYDANASQKYIYKVENGVLTAVTEKGAGQDEEGNPIEVENPVQFTGNVELKQPEEGEKYTSIAAGVFGSNEKITYVKLPAGITTITAGSFKGCTGLTGVYLPATVTNIEDSAFENCTAMTQISVPGAVTSIGGSAFKNDTRLHLVHIKNGNYSELNTIGASAFEGCSALADFCSDESFALPGKLKTIGERAFYGCKSIAKVNLSETKMNTVGAHAFEGCIGMKDLVTGRELTLIDESAFAGCTALVSVSFANGSPLKIGSRAFSGCIGLKQLTLPQSVTVLGDGAFQNCTRLTRVEVQYDNVSIEGNPFSGHGDGLIIVAGKDSNAYVYAKTNDIQTPDQDAFYQYTVEDVDGSAVQGGKFAGGTLWVGPADTIDYSKNINMLNGNKGVKSGEKCYVYYNQTSEQKGDAKETGYTFIPGSLRCNGEPIRRDDKGRYVFEMPEGGAVITAEFRKNALDKITGQNVTVEFSTGEPIRGGEKDDIWSLGVALKVGQKTRMYLIDAAGETVPAAKIRYTSKNTKIATVTAGGIITAVGTNGADSADAVITAKLVGGDGKEITVNRTVSVTAAEAKNIYLQASGYNEKLVQVEGERDGIQTAVIQKNLVNADTMTIKLQANVYDGNDSVSRELTWTTSNSKVAVLAKAQTNAGDPTNVVTVQKGSEGEATITVTAKNSPNAEKEKVTQKFVVRVYQKGYRLTSSAVTVNPNTDESGYIELISAYNLGLDEVKAGSLVLYEKNSLGTSRFTAQYDQAGSKDNCKKFRIRPDVSTISDGTYEVRVGINGEKGEKELLPLKITVKHSVPNPAVKFNSKRTKFNLFYKNGGTDADGSQTVVTTEITKLGDDKIRGAALAALTDKADDRLFTENFVIDEARSNYGEGKIVIKRSAGNLKYTSRKQAALTGYLVIYYQGYGDSVSKKIKVTMPACTTAPAYALRETSAVYPTGSGRQDELFEVYDKKSKTKEKVVLDQTYSVEETAKELTRQDPVISGDGSISINFMPEKGKLKLVLQNENWDKDQNGAERTVSFPFSVNVSSSKPVYKNNTVTLNLSYPDNGAEFKLTANQRGLGLAEKQTFTPVVTRTNGSEISKIQVSYADGQGVVRFAPGQTVKKGTYRFNCQPQVAGWPDLKTVALTVKVVDTKPAVRLGRGSLTLNTVAFKNNNMAVTDLNSKLVYGETSEISFKVNGAPEGYTLAEVGTGAQDTEVQCITRGKKGAEENFNFYVRGANLAEKTDNVLGVSLKNDSVATGTYTFQVTPRYLKAGMTTVSAAPARVNVKVYSSTDIALKVSAKGRLNLVNREGEASDKNGVIYTPTLQNLSGEISAVRIFDAGSLEEESQYFDIQMIKEGKDKGKFYVTPKKTEKSPAETPVEYEYAKLEYNKSYPVRIWVQVDGYAGTADTKGGVLSKTIQLKASQVLPKVTANKSILDVYLASKEYDAAFTVKPKTGSAGAIEDVFFEEKDEKAQESFELYTYPQDDGSIKVIVHLKKGLEYPNGSTNNIKMYVKYKGQGDKTPETATAFTMKIRIN